jgi:hypothetical protein
VSSWLADDAYVVQVERKTAFVGRNDASNRILVSGSGASSLTQESSFYADVGLDGTEVTIGIRDVSDAMRGVHSAHTHGKCAQLLCAQAPILTFILARCLVFRQDLRTPD